MSFEIVQADPSKLRFRFSDGAHGHAIVEYFNIEVQAYLEDLWVVPSARGGLLGSRLLNAVEDDARHRCATRVGCHPKPYKRDEANRPVLYVGAEREAKEASLKAWYRSRGWNEDLTFEWTENFGTWAKYLGPK